MADYSKQYCEICDPGFPWNFDLEEEFLNLYKGDQVPIICEGFGILAIGVGLDASRHVLTYDTVKWDDGSEWRDYDAGRWVEYETFLENFRTKHKNNVN